MRLADTREQQPQVVVDFGDGADRRARIVARRLLLDRDRRREPLDQIDIGFFHELQELPRVGGERFDVTALAFGIERVERKRRLAGARKARDHDQAIARQIEADVLEVVRARAADAYQFAGSGGHDRARRVECDDRGFVVGCQGR
ncbi:hypothetical protein D3C83_29080 [compost metagenome]